jgi:hypothetical protein
VTSKSVSERRRPRLLRRYTDLTVAIDALARKGLVLLDPAGWDDRNDSYFLRKYKTLRGAKSVLALCMSSLGETYHHWRVFCGHSSGVCIEFFKIELLDHLKAAPGIRSGPVRYMTLGKIERTQPGLALLPFVKRYAFRHEKEYRLIYESADLEENIHEVKIPLSLIHGIRLSPWLPKSLFEATRNVLAGIPDCSKIPISRSDLIDNERFKQVADRQLTRMQ